MDWIVAVECLYPGETVSVDDWGPPQFLRIRADTAEEAANIGLHLAAIHCQIRDDDGKLVLPRAVQLSGTFEQAVGSFDLEEVDALMDFREVTVVIKPTHQ